MVHLAKVNRDSPTDHDALAKHVDSIKLDDVPEDNSSIASVYGSRFAARQLPQDEMPEQEMPRDVAYRMIKDELSLDGNPMLKYAPPASIIILC